MDGDDTVINLVERRTKSRADAADTAKLQLLNARQRAGLDRAAFAEALSNYLAWTATADLVETWETAVVPPGDVLVAATAIAGAEQEPAPIRPFPRSTQLGGIDAAFDSRSEFTASVPIDGIFDAATVIEASGLSLNLICQQYPTRRLIERLHEGLRLECLFLRPHGQAIARREQEENYGPGELSALTSLNLRTLAERVRPSLGDAAQNHLAIGTYDETIRFNMIFIDDEMCIFQPYLHAERGVETPTMIVNRLDSGGLYPTLRRSYDWLKSRTDFSV